MPIDEARERGSVGIEYNIGRRRFVARYSWNMFVRFRKAALVTGGLTLLQYIILRYVDSLALKGDTIHSGSDFTVLLGMSLLILYALRNGASSRKIEFWWLLFAVLLLAGGGSWIFVQSIFRIMHPVPFFGLAVLLTAALGMLGNYWAHRELSQIKGRERDAKAKNAHDHVRMDFAISGAAFISGAGVFLFSLPAIDAYISLFLGPVMVYLAWKRWHERDHVECGHHHH